MKICYIAHCIGGDTIENIADLLRIVKHIKLTMPNIVPFVPYLSDVLALDDDVHSQRGRGIKNGLYIIGHSFIDQLWLTGPILSKGMMAEMDTAMAVGIEIVDLIEKI